MYQAALALLIGLMLSVSGSAWAIKLETANDEQVCRQLAKMTSKNWVYGIKIWRQEAEKREIKCALSGAPGQLGVDNSIEVFSRYSNDSLCRNLELYGSVGVKKEVKRRSLDCGLTASSTPLIKKWAKTVEIAEKAFKERNFMRAYELYEESCEQGAFDACGWAAHILVFKNTKTTLGFHERKKKAKILAEKGYANGSLFSAAILYDVVNAGTFSGCNVNTGICPGDSVLADLLKANSPAGKVRALRNCITGKGGDLAHLFHSLSNVDCCALSYETQALMEAGSLDPVSQSRAKKLSKSYKIQKCPKIQLIKPAVSSAELDAERQKRFKVEQELAALKAQQQQAISNDTQVPLITITQSGTDQRKGTIRGIARDNVQLAEVLVDGIAVNVGSDGSFEWSGFVPATGKDITIEAIDTAALSSSKVIRLERDQIQQASGPRFDDLDPTAGKRVVRNKNALALIVGISDYERTDTPAIYADRDAQYFHDYASLKLGIPDSNIMTMVNDKAELGDVVFAVKDWMRRSSKPGKSDVYVFFAGHGLASQDGEQMYLLPFDGRPRLLDDTAIARKRLFTDIASANPNTVTVFLDTCYSGKTRSKGSLIPSRPIAIVPLKQSVPDNFTVMTAAAGDQTAKPLEEAKHGMFSYFLMKGMEGEADANQDNKITAGELHSYVERNVDQQSSGSQTPELQGDADRVIVQFQ